ncbi:MAG: CBS domain-containing protein [Polyangiaceae bacterium]
MPKAVKEIMNRELFSLRPEDSAESAVGYILGLGITAAPVLDDDGRPIGLVSFRDLLRPNAPDRVKDRMSVPVLTVDADTGIEETARILAERGVHRLVVVDADGRAVGIASSLDVIRGLLGLPAWHPSAFPHWDKRFGVSWTDDTLLELDRLDVAPDGPGVLALVRGGRDVEERVVWAEALHNVRTRLYDLLSRDPEEPAVLARILSESQHLRFRAASVERMDQRESIAESLLAESLSGLPPAAT